MVDRLPEMGLGERSFQFMGTRVDEVLQGYETFSFLCGGAKIARTISMGCKA